jgi:hypothetical protein
MAEAATVTQEVRPLSDAERESLNKLLARDSAFEAPSVRRGEPYVALINLSVPRRGDKERATDLVYAGDTVYLTAEEAASFNRHGNRDGRQVDVVRKLSGPDGSRGELPKIPPRAVSGRIFRPVPPPPGSDAPRPDPEGSSAIQVYDEAPIPERDQPQPDPSEMADHLKSEPLPDAVDLPPRGGRPQGRPQQSRR